MNTEGPVRENASPGRIKIPELIIAPVAIQKTSRKVNPFFNSIFFHPIACMPLLGGCLQQLYYASFVRITFTTIPDAVGSIQRTYSVVIPSGSMIFS